MPAALFAIRLAARGARTAICIQCRAMLSRLRIRDRRHVLVDDGTQECGRTHGVDLEQSHLFGREAHLRYRVIDDDAQLGMKMNLECIGAHGKDFAVEGKRKRREKTSAIVLQRKSHINPCQPLFAPKSRFSLCFQGSVERTDAPYVAPPPRHCQPVAQLFCAAGPHKDGDHSFVSTKH